MMVDPSDANKVKLEQANSEFNVALDIEESYWKQKASVKWMVEGERNTKLFHNSVKRKQARMLIHSINDQGSVVSEKSDLSSSCIAILKNVLLERYFL